MWVFSLSRVRGFSCSRACGRVIVFLCVVGSVSFSDGWFSCWREG